MMRFFLRLKSLGVGVKTRPGLGELKKANEYFMRKDMVPENNKLEETQPHGSLKEKTPDYEDTSSSAGTRSVKSPSKSNKTDSSDNEEQEDPKDYCKGTHNKIPNIVVISSGPYRFYIKN